MEHKMLLAIGSNYDQKRYVDMAKMLLYENFGGEIAFSRSMWTLPEGIESDRFLNCVGIALTDLDLPRAQEAVKEVERLCGRMEGDRQMNIVRVDIDILTFDGKVLREEDWNRDYIQKLVKGLRRKQAAPGP